MTPTSRVFYCGDCGARVEHHLDTNVIITLNAARLLSRDGCRTCDDWIAGRKPPKAKRPGES